MLHKVVMQIKSKQNAVSISTPPDLCCSAKYMYTKTTARVSGEASYLYSTAVVRFFIVREKFQFESNYIGEPVDFGFT